MSGLLINFFGKVKNPCEDCVNGECTMNCSGRKPSEEKDFGSCFITREEDGTATLRVRSPDRDYESRINVPWDAWVSLREIGCMTAHSSTERPPTEPKGSCQS